jgi:hypothetical protein
MELDESDFIAELERMDRYFDGTEPGEIPLDRLRASGLTIPDDDSELNDAQLRAKLQEVCNAMFDLGVVFEDTGHLSDRELYRWLVLDVLRGEMLLSDYGTCHVSPIGGFGEEDIQIYLRYYADDLTRQQWETDFGDPIPPHEPLPYVRELYPQLES